MARAREIGKEPAGELSYYNDFEMDITFHYPPDLMSLLVQTIPRLCRSKKDTVLFFRGAGVDQYITSPLSVVLTKIEKA